MSVRTALYARLTAAEDLVALLPSPDAVYHQRAPASAKTPFVVLHKQSGTPRWQFDGAHIQDEVWTVKAVDRGSSATAVEEIAAQIDAALNDAELYLAGNDRTVCAVYRDGDVDYPEDDDGALYYHVGGLYRVVTV